MAAPKRLRAVTPDETPAPKRPKTLTEAIDGGTYLEILVAQRREMVRDVKDEKGPAKAAMHRQIAILSKEIEALEAAANQEAVEHDEAEDEAFDASAV